MFARAVGHLVNRVPDVGGEEDEAADDFDMDARARF